MVFLKPESPVGRALLAFTCFEATAAANPAIERFVFIVLILISS